MSHQNSLRVLGKSFVRGDVRDKALGRTIFAADLKKEGMLHAKLLTSPLPHAKIAYIDKSKARASHGVWAVLTAADIPGENLTGVRIKDRPCLCPDKVRYVGDAVALVAATTIDGAQEALGKIRVDYEPLPAVFSPDEALAEGAPLIHDSGNLLKRSWVKRGDFGSARSPGDLVVHNFYQTQWMEHAYIEPEAAVAEPAPDGRITIYAPVKFLHRDWAEVASVLGMEKSKVRIVGLKMGGGFGGKMEPVVLCYVALLALKTGRPVIMELTREESFLVSTKRHPCEIEYTSVVSHTGRLKGARINIKADTGAYASFGPSVITRCAIFAAGPYQVPNVEAEGRLVYTNNPIAGAMRGFGGPQVAFACESQMDIIAEKLGIDPLELRVSNCLEPGSQTATGQRLGAGIGARQVLEELRRFWKSPVASGRSAAAGKLKLGRGMACAYFGNGLTAFPDMAEAKAELGLGGEICLYASVSELGQGVEAIFSQIAAEELGVDYGSVIFMEPDTDISPDSGTTSATRVTYMAGNAVRAAASDLKVRMKAAAAELLEARAEDLEIMGDSIAVKGCLARGLTLAEVAQAAAKRADGGILRGWGCFKPDVVSLSPETGQGVPYNAYSFAAQTVDVAVDCETGLVSILGAVALNDAGTTINPLSLDGQIQGGASMALAMALMEEMKLKRGVIENPGFKDYLLPTSLDLPEVEAVLCAVPEPTGPFGAKGAGEPAAVPGAAAALNAIANATGMRFFKLPFSPEDLLKRRLATEAVGCVRVTNP